MIVPEVFQRSMPKVKKTKRKPLKKKEKISLKSLYGKKTNKR